MKQELLNRVLDKLPSHYDKTEGSNIHTLCSAITDGMVDYIEEQKSK